VKRISITDFNAGIIDAVDPTLIPDNALTEAENYEYLDLTGLKKRRGVDFSELNDAGFSDIHSFVVWYPSRMPSGATSDKVLIAHADGAISARWLAGSVWESQILFTDVPDDATVVFYAGYDRVLIADGVNPGRSVSVNKDAELEYGNLGIPAPLTMLEVSIADGDVRYAETDDPDVGMAVERGNILQYCYTVEDKYGTESNPSPITTEQGFMYKYPDSTQALGYKYYYRSVLVNGFSLDGYSESVKDRLKKFNIYRRDIEFQQGTIYKQFVLVQQVDIEGVSSISDSSSDGDRDINYNNNISPIASSLIEHSGVIYASGIKRPSITFPFEWDRYVEIKVNNQNNIDYVDVPVAIRLNYSELGIKPWSDYLNNRGKIRIFYSDMITPCKVVAHASGFDLYLYVWIPVMNRNVVTTLYMTLAEQKWGASKNATWDQYKYGCFHVDGQDPFVYNDIFNLPAVRDVETAVSLFIKDTGQVIIPGVVSQDVKLLPNMPDMLSIDALTTVSGYPLSRKPNSKIGYFLGSPVGASVIAPTIGATTGIDIAKIIDPPFIMTYTGLITNATGLASYQTIMRVGNIRLQLVMAGTGNRLRLIWGTDEFTVDATKFLLLWSTSSVVEFNATISIAVIMQDNVLYVYWISSDIGLPNGQSASKTVTGLVLTNDTIEICKKDPNGTTIYLYPERITVRNIAYMNDDAEKLAACKRQLYDLPDFATQVGCDQLLDISSWTNENIVTELKEIESESRKNEVQWSALGLETFPPLNFKKFKEDVLAVTDAPSFLKQQYQNTLIVFTRNTVSRIVLSDDLSKMAQIDNNVIEEFKSAGLYSPDSLISSGNAFYWLSEVGVIRWSPDGLVNLSRGKKNIPLGMDYIGAWVANSAQYLLHNRDTGITYVYHEINDAWTTFTGMSIDKVSYLNLGSDTENRILMYDGENLIEYPATQIDVSVAHKITTKQIVLDNRKPYRYRYMSERGSIADSITASTFNHYLDDEPIVAEAVSPMRYEWVYLPNGFWGEYIQLSFDNISLLTRIDLDIREGV